MKHLLQKLERRTISASSGERITRYFVGPGVTFNEITKGGNGTVHGHHVNAKIVILSGGYTEWVDGERIERNPGDVYEINENHRHWIELRKDESGKEISSYSLMAYV